MAKNDKAKAQTAINTTNQAAITNNAALKQNTVQPQTEEFHKNYQDAVTTQTGNYNDIMGQYKNQQNIAPAAPIKFNPTSTATTNYKTSPEMQQAMTGYKGFADTGGYSPTDIQELRARGVSPIRSVFSSFQRGLDKQKALGGGYSPNYGAVTAKLAREMPEQIAGQVSNVNAGLADSIRQGKLAGLSGLGGLATSDTGFRTTSDINNANARNQMSQFNTSGDINAQTVNAENDRAEKARQANLIAGQQSLYGTTPGMASMFGNQVLGSTGQLIDANQQGQQQGQANVEQQINQSQLPSNTDIALGRVGQIGKIGAGLINPWLRSAPQ